MDIEQHYLRSMLDQMREPPEPVEGPGGAAFGVFPAMRSAARPGVKSEAAAMLPADVAAGVGKGLITGGVGLPGDIESLIRGVRGIFTRGGDQGKLDAFLTGMEEKTILPTSEDVSKWLDTNVGPVVPPGAPMAKQRAGVAGAGQFAGEMVSGPGTLVKGAKAGAAGAAATVKFVKPKVGEMLSDYMSRSGLTPELMAYHGTPHRFAAEEGAPLGRFRSEKIGTGEGAQAYGYGLYFAESPGVAKSYQQDLSAQIPIVFNGKSYADSPKSQKRLFNDLRTWAANNNRDPDVYEMAGDWIAGQAGDSDLALKLATPDLGFGPEHIEAMKELSPLFPKVNVEGSLYTVDIPNDVVGKMLDYDKPLSSQPAELQSKLKSVVDAEMGAGIWDQWIKSRPDFRNLKDDLFENKTDAELSDLLRKAGIPGIRYLDRDSRSIGVGTRNIVVFPGEEDKVKILKVE